MAIGKIFEFRNKQIIPKDDCYHNVHIKAMFDKYPDEHIKLCAYLHYMNSMKREDNPYADVPMSDRSDQLVNALDIKAEVEDPIIIRALSAVEDIYYTTFYGIYGGAKAAMDKIGKSLKTVEIDFNNRDGNIANIIRLMKDYEAIRNSFKAAYRDFDEETGNVKVRGNSRLAIDEIDETDDEDEMKEDDDETKEGGDETKEDDDK